MIFKVCYLFIYNWIINNNTNKLKKRQVHILLMSVLTTALLMWLYTVLAYYSIANSIPFIVGVAASTIHLLSPLLLRITPNIFLVSAVTLSAGLAHQSTFAFYSGGFKSEILIWYGIIPLLGGMIAGKNAALLWGVIVTFISSLFIYAHFIGHEFPNLLSPNGHLYSHILLITGWIGVSTLVIHIFNLLLEKHEIALEDETKKLDGLLRILMHDMSNSIHIMKGTLSLMDMTQRSEKELKNLKTIGKHNNFLADTLKSIKSMYVLKKNLKDPELISMNLCEAINYILTILEQRIDDKKINIDWVQGEEEIFIMAIPHILENQVIQNILTNAIKFTNIGKSISITITSDQKQSPAVTVLTVKDNGVGMPNDILENIFNPAVRTSRPGTEKEAGTGLGMHIVKNFIEEMKASIQIFSLEGQGTEVKITFLSAPSK